MEGTLMRRLAVFLWGVLLLGLLASCGSEVVTFDHQRYDLERHTTEIPMGKTFEVDMGPMPEISTDPEAYEWVVVESGNLTLVSTERVERPEDPAEFPGGVAVGKNFVFEPTAPGPGYILFHFVPTGTADADPAFTMSVPFVVTE
jgi:hypothetical protein